MKTIIAGSRHCSDYALLLLAIEESGFPITQVVSGCARGVDTMGERWAARNDIPVKRFPADWDTHGKAAGPIRNKEMAEYADALIAIQFPGSRGTANMIYQAQKMGLQVYVKRVSSSEQTTL